ncbi:alpha/beta fold hydrolase [Aquimarina agarilytica]|uniref:alpha/beta fold hydrolase n=1 Tax=Aquimarina agarilytica TaxID=1087449 RepID=UPI00028944EE|nr:alpha/beta fold hydrolase [Aquimarina agarilytica]
MKTISRLSQLLTLLLLTLLLSCSNDDDTSTILPSGETEKIATEIKFQEFPDINKLYVGKGNKNSDTVIIFEQGGPSIELSLYCLENVNTDNPEENNDLADHLVDYYRVYAHQALSFDKKNNKKDKINKQEALRLRELNADILNALITQFKNNGKTVIVIGHSYGGFVIQQYLSKFGNKKADKFIIMASRLNMDLQISESWKKITPNHFDIDGKTILPYKEEKEDLTDPESPQNAPLIFSLGGYHVEERFTETIKITSIENLLYVHALNDQQTGRLSIEELHFLNQRNSKIIEIPNTTEDGHSAPFIEPYASQISDFINK